MLNLPPNDLSHPRPLPAAPSRGHALRQDSAARAAAAARVVPLRIATGLGAPDGPAARSPAPAGAPAPAQARPLADLIRVLARLPSAVPGPKASEPPQPALPERRAESATPSTDRAAAPAPRPGPELAAPSTLSAAVLTSLASAAAQPFAAAAVAEHSEQPSPRAELVPPQGGRGAAGESPAAVPAALVAACFLALVALLLAAV